MTHLTSTRALRIVGAFAAVGGAVLWLAFFVEHVTAWFTGPPWPPPVAKPPPKPPVPPGQLPDATQVPRAQAVIWKLHELSSAHSHVSIEPLRQQADHE